MGGGPGRENRRFPPLESRPAGDCRRLPGKEGWTERVETLLDTRTLKAALGSSRPLLLLSGLTDAELDDLLAQLRGAKAVWPYKAVVTPYNRSWSLEKLYRELEQEHRAVTGGGNEE